ncbi:MAG: hypothetical protein JW708_05770 [Vallitaleaceae bacterium]|nr:hypothetical protein [Vallitaleaceae bacterium]
MPITRYFSDENFARFKTDFQFIVRTITSYKAELELCLRENYFNLYFRGNSIAKVLFKRDRRYEVHIHEKFYPTSLSKDSRFSPPKSIDTYCCLDVSVELLHPLFQKKYLAEMFSNIKQENHSEELTLEQMIITDNIENEKVIIIDRQITDIVLKKRIDLLALRQHHGNTYQFVIIEVKMGNNPELKDSVARQLNGYVTHVEKYFPDYKMCYEKHYKQKKELELIKKPDWNEIEIIPDVQGIVIVGGYSQIAQERIDELTKNYPKLWVKRFAYDLDFLCN